MNQRKFEKLDEHIASLRKRLEFAEGLREGVRNDPELLGLLGNGREKESAPLGDNGVARRRGRKNKSLSPILGGPVAHGYFEKVAKFLESKGNQAHSIQEIANAVGLKHSNVVQITYRTHAALFDQQNVAGHKNRKKWRLKPNWKDLSSADKA